jgi:glycosyltransferase involved in cell wall biosynthesis
VTRKAPRRSIGGQVVEAGLASLGFDVVRPDIAMVETRVPGLRPFDIVLSQSPWNVLPRADFLRLSRPYPRVMRRRMWARRAVAAVNLRRARRVLSLTEANAEQVRRFSGREVEVAPVWLPLDALELSPRPRAEPTDRGFVPGTLIWYKNPAAALDVAKRRGIAELLFAGPDDGSGCWRDLELRAEAAGVRVSRTLLSRQEMYDELAAASAVILPSELETLGFSLGEAMCLAPQVLASPIPSHLEVAHQLGAEPEWLPAQGPEWQRAEPVAPDAAAVRGSWISLGEALGLERRMVG